MSEIDYLRRLVRQTQRDDLALLAGGPALGVDYEASVDLLRALAAKWPTNHFEEVNVAVEAPYNSALRRAIDPINPRFDRCRGGPALTSRCQMALRRWLLSLLGRDVGGLRLTVDQIGWFEIEPVRGWQQ